VHSLLNVQSLDGSLCCADGGAVPGGLCGGDPHHQPAGHGHAAQHVRRLLHCFYWKTFCNIVCFPMDPHSAAMRCIILQHLNAMMWPHISASAAGNRSRGGTSTGTVTCCDCFWQVRDEPGAVHQPAHAGQHGAEVRQGLPLDAVHRRGQRQPPPRAACFLIDMQLLAVPVPLSLSTGMQGLG